VNAAFIDGLLTINIAAFPLFSGLLYFFTGQECYWFQNEVKKQYLQFLSMLIRGMG
jgi:hypothetical protein